MCILNGNERINWRKYIYSQYNPYKKVSLYRKLPQCSYFMINKGLKKSAKIEWSEPSHLNSSFLIRTWILNLFRKRSTYRKKSPKTVPDDNIKRKFLQNGLKQHIWSVFLGPLSIFKCTQDLIFARYHFFFFFLYNVLTTNWIVFFSAPPNMFVTSK